MGAIEGIVKKADNSPIEEASIMIMAGPSHQDIASLTDANGNFAISNLRSGNYIIKVYGPSESDDIPVQVNASQVAFIEIWLNAKNGSPTDLTDEGSIVIDEVNFFEDEEDHAGILSTKWRIKCIKPATSKVLNAQNHYILDLTANNTYSLQLDVNNCVGQYSIYANGRIAFTEAGCTEMYGDSGFATQLAKLIPRMTQFEIRNNELVLKGSGEITLTRYLSF